MEWYLKVLSNYSDFSGRARRKEYWFFILFNSIFLSLIMLFSFLMGLFLFGFIAYLIYSIFIFIPSLAVLVRRLHDIGKTGWFFLITLIPIAGAVWLLILLLTESDPGINRYGPCPKEMAYWVSPVANKHHLNPAPPNSTFTDQPNNQREDLVTPLLNQPRNQINQAKIKDNKFIFPILLYQRNGNYSGKYYRIVGTNRGEHFESILGRPSADFNPDIMINESIISRKHLAVAMKDGLYYIRLLAAKNPTLLNSNKLNDISFRQFKIGDILQIGDLNFEFTSC